MPPLQTSNPARVTRNPCVCYWTNGGADDRNYLTNSAIAASRTKTSSNGQERDHQPMSRAAKIISTLDLKGSDHPLRPRYRKLIDSRDVRDATYGPHILHSHKARDDGTTVTARRPWRIRFR